MRLNGNMSRKVIEYLIKCVLLPFLAIFTIFWIILHGNAPTYDSIPHGDGSSPYKVIDMWYIHEDLWHLEGNSRLYCNELEATDLPTYKADWNPQSERFYYVQKHTLWSYDPVTGQNEKLRFIDRDADYLYAVTSNYVIATDRYLAFIIDLRDLSIFETTLPTGELADTREDELLLLNGTELTAYSCETGKGRLLFVSEKESVHSACYSDLGVTLLCGSRILLQIDRDTKRITETELPFDAARVDQTERLWLLEYRQAADGYLLYLWQQAKDGTFREVSIDEHFYYYPVLDNCTLLTSGQCFAVASDAFVTTGVFP